MSKYYFWSEKQRSIFNGNAFNINAKSLTLANFTPKQVSDLLLQHTKETGQKFDKDAIAYVFEQTQGQPWLVNTLAYQACFRDVTDRSKPITLEVMQRARKAIIKNKDAHLQTIIATLDEQRVYEIINGIILNNKAFKKRDDVDYCINTGLITQRGLCITNPIYQDVIKQKYSPKAKLLENEQ